MKLLLSISLVFAITVASCTTPITKDYSFSAEDAALESDALLVFVRPLQYQTWFQMNGVDLEAGQTTDTKYMLGAGGMIAVNADVIRTNVDQLSEENKALFLSSRNYIDEYGVLNVKAGDYAIVGHFGGNYATNCMDDRALTFRVEAGKINVLDNLNSLHLRGLMTERGETPANHRMEGYISDAIKAFPNISGEVQMVKPLALLDFEKAQTLKTPFGGCGETASFRQFSFSGVAEFEWE